MILVQNIGQSIDIRPLQKNFQDLVNIFTISSIIIIVINENALLVLIALRHCSYVKTFAIQGFIFLLIETFNISYNFYISTYRSWLDPSLKDYFKSKYTWTRLNFSVIKISIFFILLLIIRMLYLVAILTDIHPSIHRKIIHTHFKSQYKFTRQSQNTYKQFYVKNKRLILWKSVFLLVSIPNGPKFNLLVLK